MFEMLGAYIKNIAAFMIFVILAEIAVPESSFKKYLSIVLGFLITATLFNPIVKMVSGGNVDFSYLAYIDFNENSSPYSNNAEYYSDIQNGIVNDIYRKELQESIGQRLSNEGYYVLKVFANAGDNGSINYVEIELDKNGVKNQSDIYIKPVEPVMSNNTASYESDEGYEEIFGILKNEYGIEKEQISIISQ